MRTFTPTPVVHALRTAVVAVCVCAQLGTALALSPAMPPGVTSKGGSVWPEPVRPQLPTQPVQPAQPVQPVQPVQWQGGAPQFSPIHSVPQFSAPSASHCAQAPQFREIGGRSAQQRGETALGGVHRERTSEAAAKSAAPRSEPATSVGAADTAVLSAPTGAAVRRAPPPPMSAPAPLRAPAAAALPDGRQPTFEAAPRAPIQRPASQPVTAGVVDDNAAFAEYLAFKARTPVRHLARDVSERHLVEVKDASGRTVADAEVLVHASSGAATWARTDAAGRFWLHPLAFDPQGSPVYQITARAPGSGRWFGSAPLVEATAMLQRGQKSAVELRLPAAHERASRAQLDLVFMIDATGSMGDEIDKLKGTLRTIADQVARLPARPDICFGLVAYRDVGDEYVVRSHDMTSDLEAFQAGLNSVQAGGGGDYPEAMSEALTEAVQNLSWRGGSAGRNATTRMVLLLADAPPQMGRGEVPYDQTMAAALGKGIKVFSVGASGLDKRGEFIQRQIAQFTGGKFVFLTYAQAGNPASGPGRETVHDVRNYSVDTLDQLVVRLVKEELAPLAQK